MFEFIGILSLFVLLSSFILMGNKRISSYIQTFRVQSLLIALMAGIAGLITLKQEGRIDILAVCLLTVLLKVIYIPSLLHRTYAGVKQKVEKDFILNIPILVLVCCGLVVFTYFCLGSLKGVISSGTHLQLVNSVSVIWIGLFFMISRRKAIGQIIGFLVIENGLFVTAMLATEGMPFIVDLGIFIDMITAVLIMGILVFRINNKFDSIDTDNLNKLKG